MSFSLMDTGQELEDVRNFLESGELDFLHEACYNGQIEIVRTLIEMGMPVDEKDSDGNTPALVAAKQNHSDVVLELVDKSIFDVNIKNHHGNTLLHEACRKGWLVIVKKLIEKGATINNKDNDGLTPLFVAAAKSHSHIVVVLIEFGCEVSAEDREMINIMNKKSHIDGTYLLLVVKMNYVNVATVLVQEFGYDVNINDEHGNTPLHVACQYGHLEMTKVLINLGAALNKENYNGCSPVLLAAKLKHRNVVWPLVSGFGCDFNVADRYGCTLLHEACRNGWFELVKLLVSTGAPINVKDNNGRTPLFVAAEENHGDIVSTLVIDYNCEVDLEDKHGQSLLHVACKHGHLDIVEKVKVYMDYSGKSPLALALENGRHEIATKLLKRFKKVDGTVLIHSACNAGTSMVRAILQHDPSTKVDVKDKDGDTPLHIAIKKGDIQLFSTLLHHCPSAKLDVRNNNGDTPLHIAHGSRKLLHVIKAIAKVEVGKGENHSEVAPPILHCTGCKLHDIDYEQQTVPLVLAVRYNQYLIVTILLKELKYDPNSKDINGYTALHWACHNSNLSMVQILMKHGATVNTKDSKGLTPLHWACYTHNFSISIIKALIKHGAVVNGKDCNGNTPLHWACCSGMVGIVQTLLKHGANVNTADNNGLISLHWASRNGKADMINSLITHKVKIDGKDKDELTPLHWACCNGELDAVKILLKHDAKVNEKDRNGLTPLHLVCRSYDLSMMIEVLEQHDSNEQILQLCDGKLGIVQTLIQHGADVHSEDGNETLQHNSVVNVVQTLIHHGANVNKEDSNGQTLFYWACSNGNLGLVHCLMQHGIDANKFDALLSAVKNNHCDIVEALVAEYGCAIVSQGTSLLHLAAARGHTEMVKILITKHALPVSLVDEEGNTPLHVAMENGHCSCVESLLYEFKSPVFIRNSAGKTPGDLASLETPHIKELYDNYVKCKSQDIEAYYTAMENVATSKYSGSHCITRLFVVGNPEAGKSSLIEALKREGSIQSLNRVSEKSVLRHTTGILPSVYTSAVYGRVQFYDFAGDPEYYSSHAAILERVFQSDIGINIFLIVLNLEKNKCEIDKQFIAWYNFITHNTKHFEHFPLILVIGSHVDSLASQVIPKERIVKGLCSQYEVIDYFLLDCRNPRSKSIKNFRQKIQALSSKGLPFKLPYEGLVLLGLLENDFSNVIACPAETLVTHVHNHDLLRLPRSFSGLYPFLQQLQAIGIILVLGCKEEDCYLILDIPRLTNLVHERLFAKQQCYSKSDGFFSLSELNLPPYITKNCLIQLQYCQEILPIENGNTTTTETKLFFPALCRKDKEISWQLPMEGNCIGWLARCSQPLKYFSCRFQDVLLVRIPYFFSHSVTASEEHVHRWKRGVHWLNGNGIECEVDVDISKEVVVRVRSQKNSKECFTLFNSIIQCIIETKKEFCHSTPLNYFLMEEGGDLSDDYLFSLKNVEQALEISDQKVLSVSGKSYMCSTKLQHIRSTFWSTLFSIDEHSVLGYIESLVTEWFPLGQSLQYPTSKLKTIEANYPNNVGRQKREMIFSWLGSCDSAHPPCWWTLVKALQDMGENAIARAIFKDFGDVISLQEKLVESKFQDQKPDNEFLQSFSTVVGSNWLYLAALLSLSSAEINTIRVKGKGQSDRNNAFLMLVHWSSKNEATYNHLYNKIKPISLFDLCQ